MTHREHHMTVLHLDEQRGLRGGELQAGWLMARQVEWGHRVYAAGRPDAPFLSERVGGSGIRRIVLPLRGEWDLHSAWLVARWCQREGVELIHAHTSHTHGIALLAASLCGRRFRPKVVVSRRVAFEPGNHLFNRWKYNRPDCILCVSAEVFETLRRWGCNPEKMRVVHSAVDSSRLEAVPVSRRDFGIPSDVPLLVTAGALEPHKDHAMLLEAFALVRRHVHNACLAIAGDGRLRSNLEKQVQEMGLADSVKFLGYRSDAPSVIAAGDVYVSSSWSEGLGTSILEAMGMGVPVVATRAGGAGEMIIPGVTGWLVPARNARLLADALVECLQHREQAAQMAANARLLARGYYSADRMARHTLSAYGGLLGKPIAGADPAPCSDPYEWLRQQGIEVNAGCQPGKAR